mmetsp:Transcript_12544/g.41685  ORF Transcript_12544/g.41685 Transcript_12544/m.41685 type:complete len:214 (+) Transcript_12544:443-1084(+)
MKQSVPAFNVISLPMPPSGSVTSSNARRIKIGGAGYKRMLSANTARVFFNPRISSTVGAPPGSATTASTSAAAARISSGCFASRNMVHVSTAAVVSCPAINSVIRSSLSCFEVTSSPDAMRKFKMDGLSWLMYSSTNSSSSSSTICLVRSMSMFSVSFTTTSASVHAFCRGTSHCSGGTFQYGMKVTLRYSASRKTVYTALITGSSVFRELKS